MTGRTSLVEGKRRCKRNSKAMGGRQLQMSSETPTDGDVRRNGMLKQ